MSDHKNENQTHYLPICMSIGLGIAVGGRIDYLNRRKMEK